jgi:cytochrome c5
MINDRDIVYGTNELSRSLLIVAVVYTCVFLHACSEPDTGSNTDTPLAAAEPESFLPDPAAITAGENAIPDTVYAGVLKTGTSQEPEAGTPIDGGQIYNTYCAVCHKAGLNAAPKYGDKILWGRVVKKGRETVYGNAINGVRGMPPRGGIAGLSDEEIKAATDYIVGRSGGWGDAK